MKQPIAIIAAMALAINVQAQETAADGIKMYNYERYQTAKRILAPLASGDPVANYYLGLSELQLGNKDVAKAIFQKVPENHANMSGLAKISFVENNPTDGMAKAKALADRAKKKDWEQLKYAAEAITYTENTSADHVQQAIDWYKAALVNKDAVDMRISLGDAYNRLPSGGGEAINNYEKAIEKDPKNSLVYSRMGKLWYQSRNYKLALENWEKAQEADPSNPLPYRDLADAYTKIGKYDLAKKNADKYMELSDKTDADKEKYMDVLFLSKSWQEAINLANELIGKGRKDARIYGILGFSYLELKDTANALKNARMYIEQQDPKKVTPADYRSFAKVLLSNSKNEEADQYLQRSITSDTSVNKSEAYRENGEMLREAREWVKAAEWYERIIMEYPNDVKATDYFYGGFTRYYGRDYVKAADNFAKMRTKYPAEPSPIYWQGRVAAAVDNEGKNCSAAPYYEEWLTMKTPDTYQRKNPDLMQAYQYLLLCYYNKNDKGNMQKYMDLIRAIEPNNSMLKQIENATKSGGASSAPKKKQ